MPQISPYIPKTIAHSAKNIRHGPDAEVRDIERVRRALNHSSDSITLIYAMADRQLAAKNRRWQARKGGKMS